MVRKYTEGLGFESKLDPRIEYFSISQHNINILVMPCKQIYLLQSCSLVKKDIEMYYIRTDTVQFSGWISLLYAAGILCCSTEVVFAAAPASWVSAATLHVLSEPVASDQQLEDPGSNPCWISMSFFLPTNNSTINTSPYNFSLRQAKHFEQLSFGRSSGTLEQRIDGKGCFFQEEEMFPVSP